MKALKLLFVGLLISFVAWPATAAAIDCSVAPSASKGESLERSTFKDLARDQACIWTSPIHLRENRNWTLFVPWAGASAGLIATDRAVIRAVPDSPSAIRRAKHISDAGFFGELALSGALYLTGLAQSNPRLRETGWLAGEAVANGMAVNLATQAVSARNRPNDAARPAEWFRSGRAFPSDHSMASWAAATVIAHQYPGWLSQSLVYGTATTVSVARVLALQHSPSDVFVGSSIGFLIGRFVYMSHHPEDVSRERLVGNPFAKLKLRNARAPYLPLDSPYYPMFQRLISAGYIDSAIVGLRPWTRTECARLVDEAATMMPPEAPESMREVLSELKQEFPSKYGDENPRLPIESIYTRVTGISGTPLRDSFHFGQTLYNDYGRPYWTGMNTNVGASGATAMGPITFYARGEFQQSPSGGPVYSTAVQNQFMVIDQTPTPLIPNASGTTQFRLIEGYAAAPIKNVEISFGKQALWWGTSWDSAMLASNNSEPIYQLRLSQISPIRLPWVFRYLGPMRVDAFIGKFSGAQYPRQPYLHGQKVTFKPTRDLEFGFSRTVIFAGGPGHPMTLGQFWRSFSSFGDKVTTAPGSSSDVGDRRGGFDFSYRLPHLRDRVTIYGDFFTDDDPSPLAAIRRSSWDPGILISRLPFLPKMDLRIEAPVSSPPFPTPNPGSPDPTGGVFFYRNAFFLNGYTNKGFIYGNWIGRQAKGIFASTRYWFSPMNVLEASYRHSTLDPKFIRPGAGNYTDGRVDYRRTLKSNLLLDASVQLERWNVPLIAATPKRNSVISVGVTWSPSFRSKSESKK
jgi:membrane-associated phospholipid phosphatase